MDAFFTSVEEVLNPNLVGLPVAVASSDRRAVVATANYVARKYGVRSTVSVVDAMALCPELIIVNPKGDQYRLFSEKVFKVLNSITPLVEKVGSDEAYLDVTDVCNGSEEKLLELCKTIKERVKNETGLVISIGAGINKFIAKVAGGLEKPNGLTYISESKSQQFMLDLPIAEFRGVGAKTLQVFKDHNITNGHDLYKLSYDKLVSIFGNHRAVWFFEVVRVIDLREVETIHERRSLNINRTFNKDIFKDKEAVAEIWSIATEMERRLTKRGLYGKTLTIKAKYIDFNVVSRSTTNGLYFRNKLDIFYNCVKMLQDKPLLQPIRLIGLSVSNLEDESTALW
jgi:DNA polymerase-4